MVNIASILVQVPLSFVAIVSARQRFSLCTCFLFAFYSWLDFSGVALLLNWDLRCVADYPGFHGDGSSLGVVGWSQSDGWQYYCVNVGLCVDLRAVTSLAH